MIKKEILIPVILVVVGMAFVVISVLVYFSKGNATLIKQKLKLGAIIIGITATAASCVHRGCYDQDVPMNDEFHFDTDSNYHYNLINLKLSKDSQITGKIDYCTKKQYSYMITDTLKTEIFRDNIIPEDGIFNSTTERFIIKIPQTIDTGKYYLNLYNIEKTFIDRQFLKTGRTIKITK